MLKKLTKYFLSGNNTKATSEIDIEKKTKLACCVLLLEIAQCDYNFKLEEKSVISDILKKNLGVSREELEKTLLAAENHRKESVDLYEYTRLINRNFSLEEKKDLIEMIWQVIYADGVLDKYEDYLVHKLGDLLHISHRDLINIKIEVKNRSGKFS